MSMLDSFFNKGFKASKCKTLLKLTIPRIKLLRNKRELQIRQMRKEIAKLLETGQEATARIRVEHIIREENMMAAQEIIELFCELISARLPIIETQRECPLDLKEAISSVCFAAPRCADLPELLQVQLAFASKYGKEFVMAATGLLPACGVNRQLIELFSVRAPPAEKKLTLLKEIAEEHGLDWDPAASETELFKSHEDLLDGSTQYVTGSKMPLPKEKHEEVLHSTATEDTNEQSDSDSGLDSLVFPEVPKVVLRPSTEPNSTREEAPLPSAPHPELDRERVTGYENITYQTSKGPEDETLQSSDHEMPRPSEARQFVPFIYPPPLPSQSVSFKETDLTIESPAIVQSETTDPSPISPPSVKNVTTDPSLQSLSMKSEINVDLEDVLVAARAAAESAERAAAAARSVATLAQVRISEFSSKKHSQSLDSFSENPFGMEDKLHLDHQVSAADADDSINVTHSMPEHHENNQFANGSPSLPTYNASESLFKTSSFDEDVHEQVNPQQLPHRMTSTEDDLLSSYPNLFGSGSQSFTDTSHSNT